jgi:hypothetical protein
MIKFRPPDPWDSEDTSLNVEKGGLLAPFCFSGRFA